MSPYFSRDELFETLIGRDYNPKEEIVVRRTYTYKTGSKYTGEWKGGFRHGIGVMRWTDGAKFEGQWNEGRANGFGKFTHVNGDFYRGQWFNDKA